MAPDSLPDAAHIVGTDWSVCAVGNAADGEPLRTAVLPGRLADGAPMGTGAYLVRTTSGRNYLISAGHAFRSPASGSRRSVTRSRSRAGRR